MSTFKVLTASLAIALLVAGCGGNSKTLVQPTTTPSGGGGGTTAATEEMGAAVSGTFTQGALSTTLPAGSQLSAGGSTSITVQFQVTKTGAPATDAIQIAWTSKCPSGTVTFNPATGTNASGSLTTTYTNNGGCTLASDTVTAAVTSGGTNLASTNTTASTSIPLATAVANSIVFISASPTNIGLKGTGQPSTSQVTFEVETAGGGPVAGVTVNFTLSTTIGGISLVNASSTTGTNGQAVATVQAGTRAATVSVTATAQTPGGQISADSNTLSVSTGITDANSVSAATPQLNMETLHHFGVTAPVTVRLKDRFSNPVPDGTSVIFSTSGGGITPSCVTATTMTESGVCTVQWVSQDPIPPYGRARIIAVVVGEKHFTDNYGVGYFEGPPVPGFATADPFVDIGDPYRDDNENGVYDVGEVFYDINGSKTYQGPTGKYVGLLCGGPAPTILPTLCTANNSTMYVSDQFTLVMSGDTPTVTLVSGSPVTATTDPVVSFLVTDENGNAMPVGTTIAINPPSGVTAQPQSVTVPNTVATANPALTTNPYYSPSSLTYSFGLSEQTATGHTGPVSLTITTPDSLTTTVFTSLLVNY